MNEIKRLPFAAKCKPGMMDEFTGRIQNLRPELYDAFERLNIRNLSVWNVDDLVFMYCEQHGSVAPSEKEMEYFKGWQKSIEDCCDFIGLPDSKPMRLMYEDLGIVRQDKSEIRHRVFVTKLKPGCAEEYKRRHDELVEARGATINPGPESNFTIWNGDNYIFGYCELVKAMDHEMTEEEKQASISWEIRGLEIMDWITDDVDWITGQKHHKIKCIFSYK